ncbi:MAG: APC family permease [Hyphomonas sp.]
MTDIQSSTATDDTLKRRLSLPLLVLYGLGVTVGAGIYVLVGLTARDAGVYAPVSFMLAAAVVAFTGYSYAELSTRFPVSSGEAAYTRRAFGSKGFSLCVGLMVACVGLVSSATIAIGAGAYLNHFIPLSPILLSVFLICLLALIAGLGVLESVAIAAVFTVVEIAGLAFVVVFGVWTSPEILSELHTLVPPLKISAWSGIASAGLLAFFAFVGFEDLANIAEEAIEPRKNLPRAILLTLFIATAIYLVVVSVVVLVVPMDQLRGSAAPLSLVFDEEHRAAGQALNVVAGVATLNGVLIQMIMASRVLFGLSRQKSLPAVLGYVHPKTRTPLVATGLVAVAVLIFALFLPIEKLATLTSSLMLIVFVVINTALVWLKMQESIAPSDIYEVPVIVPVIGAITCAALLIAGLF